MGSGEWGVWSRDAINRVSTGVKSYYFPTMPHANAQCPMPNAPCPMPHAQCPMPHAQCPMPNAQFPSSPHL
ncbi:MULTISPECIES: hypothetical protein [unclassified Nostoc]|uniref:hypothetical protein n=1 Tax=unclassified Nostoc TaxID=2593658 RepID=UPI002630F12F|nr:hypothetical protein [Nostoc sp. S13]MDF5736359.1 hypothetical protein [Nostoc sp. S13]